MFIETTGVLRRRSGRPVARALVETPIGPRALGESISSGTRVNIGVDVLSRLVAEKPDSAGRGAKTEDSHADHDQRFLDELRSGGWT